MLLTKLRCFCSRRLIRAPFTLLARRGDLGLVDRTGCSRFLACLFCWRHIRLHLLFVASLVLGCHCLEFLHVSAHEKSGRNWRTDIPTSKSSAEVRGCTTTCCQGKGLRGTQHARLYSQERQSNLFPPLLPASHLNIRAYLYHPNVRAYKLTRTYSFPTFFSSSPSTFHSLPIMAESSVIFLSLLASLTRPRILLQKKIYATICGRSGLSQTFPYARRWR